MENSYMYIHVCVYIKGSYWKSSMQLYMRIHVPLVDWDSLSMIVGQISH